MNLQVVSLCLSSNTSLKMSSLVSILSREKRRHLFPPVTIPQQLTTPPLSLRLLVTGMRRKNKITRHSSRSKFVYIVFFSHCLRKEQEMLTYEAGTYSKTYSLGQKQTWTSTGSAISLLIKFEPQVFHDWK